jgi:PleD family two-component response regulator
VSPRVFGVSSFTQDAEQQDGIMIRADKKLYESKRKGKNAVSH